MMLISTNVNKVICGVYVHAIGCIVNLDVDVI